jgi:hypothetical protein
MASYTDIAPKFNPYIQQLPIEAMVQVGMEKQRRYDEGLQKIQTNIDNIAGLDVYNDVDKQYLQSKLNDLGSKLKTVAAGDFSNYQLVNSVGGMVKQIGKDTTIQNAVKSTAMYRKDLQRNREDIDSGKALAENTDYLAVTASKWLNATKPGEAYTGRYMTPINIWDKIKDIAKEIGVEEKEIPQLYQTDAQGNVLYNYDKDGNKTSAKWNPVMATKILKGKDPDKVLSAFQNALTPDDYEQMAITGRYINKNKTPEMLKESIVNQSASQIKAASTRLDDFKVALFNEESKNEKNLDKIASLKKSVEYFDKLSNNLIQTRDKNLQRVNSNPDTVRASLYTDSYLTSMAVNLSGQSEAVKYSVNPIQTITMDTNRWNRELERDRVEDRKWSYEQKTEAEKFEYQKQKDGLDFFEKTGIVLPGVKIPSIATAPKLLPEPITTEDIAGGKIKASVEDDYSAGVSNLNDVNYKLTLLYYKNINRDNQLPNESEEQYTERMRQAISKFASGNKENISSDTGEINSFTTRFASKLLTEAKLNKNVIPVQFRELVNVQNNLVENLSLQKEQMQQVTKEAIAEGTRRGLLMPKPEDIAKNVKPIKVLNSIGNSITLNSTDVVDLINSNKERFSIPGAIFTTKENQLTSKRAQNRLLLKYGKQELDNINKQLFSSAQEYVEGYTSGNKDIEKSAAWLRANNYNSLSKIESEIYVKKGIIKQPVSTEISRGTGKDLEAANSRISAVIDSYPDINEIPGYDQAKIQAAILSNDPAAVKIISYPGISARTPTRHVLQVTLPDNTKIPIQIDDVQYNYITKKLPPSNSSIPKVVERINYFGTSNLSGSDNPESAWWGDDKFTNFDSPIHTITGDLIPDEANKNKLWFNMYLIPKKEGQDIKKITFPEAMNMYNTDGTINMQLDNLPMGVNSTVINQLIKQR